MSGFIRMSAPATLTAALKTEGYAKVRLAHGDRGTIVVVDALFALRHLTSSIWDYYLPSFYGPPVLAFNLGQHDGQGSFHTLRISVDFAGPRKTEALRVSLSFRSDDRASTYNDGAQLYRCTIEHNEPLIHCRAGCARYDGNSFYLKAFHHTTFTARIKIKSSGYLLGSPWNLQGTRKLLNVRYPYFTTLRRIRNEFDLMRIAMASSGEIHLRGTGGYATPDPLVTLMVYRESTSNRRSPMSFWIPAEIIAPNHLRFHRPLGSAAGYYEVVLPEVVRVGITPDSVLRIYGDAVHPREDQLRTFDYLVCGDAATDDGLIAPFDEENTSDVVHLERLTNGDLFQFWQQNANSDQVSDRKPEYRILEDKI